MTPRSDSPRALIRYALVGLALTVAISWMVYLVRDTVLLIYVTALVAIGLSPMVNAIERRRLPTGAARVPRWAAILVIYSSIIGIVIGIGMAIVPPLIEQARELWRRGPALLHAAQQWLIDRGLLSRELTFREAVQQSTDGTDAVGAVIAAVWSFIGGVFGLVTILVLGFYLLVESERIIATFLRLFPPSERKRVENACRRVASRVSAWLGGQILLAGIIGASAAVGLFMMGVPYFYVLALIAAIGEMIPIVGPLLSAMPAIAIAISVSPALAVAVAIFFFAQQQFENHILVPKIMERQVGVSPVVVIIALLIGGSLLGIMGAILAVPTAAILQVLFEELAPDAVSEADADGRIASR